MNQQTLQRAIELSGKISTQDANITAAKALLAQVADHPDDHKELSFEIHMNGRRFWFSVDGREVLEFILAKSEEKHNTLTDEFANL